MLARGCDMRYVVLVVVLVLVSTAAVGSEPGQPLDCSDWVFLEPGLSCTVRVEDCDSDANPWCDILHSFLDNEGYRYHIREVVTGKPCDGAPVIRTELLRFNESTETVFAYLGGRCVTPGVSDNALMDNTFFDEERGHLFVTIRSLACSPGCTPVRKWNAAIEGFTTTFEILQSYEPSTNAWGFRVPYMPEGFPAADYFDTYHGDLATVGDWSRAQPLACGFPTTAPRVGDYLTVADPLPAPAPNSGRYYVTAVTHQGQRRYGRQRLVGVLQGRDPAVLPACAGP